MKRWIALAGCLAMWNAGAVPVGAIEVSRLPTGGMKIFAVAKGDCAQGPSTILVTDATTSCSIEIRVTPAKKYADVGILVPLPGATFSFPTWIVGDGKVNMSSKGKGSAAILKTRNGCVLVGGTAKVVVQATNANKFLGRFTASVKSKPITVTYQQSEPEIGACFSTVSGASLEEWSG